MPKIRRSSPTFLRRISASTGSAICSITILRGWSGHKCVARTYGRVRNSYLVLTEKLPLADYFMSFATRSRVFFEWGGSCPYPSSLLPEIVSKDSPTRPYRRRWRASGQHSAQREFAFEHTDRRFHPTAESLQRSKPPPMLMPAFYRSQATDFGNDHPLYTRLLKLPHILGAVVSSIRGQLFWLDAEALFALPHHRKQLRAVVGVAVVDFIVNDDSTTILRELQRAPKLHGPVELALADGARTRIMEGDNPLRYRLLPLKLLIGLAQNSLGQLDLLSKLFSRLDRLLRSRAAEGLKGLAALLDGMLGELGRRFKNFAPLFIALLGFRPGRLTPSKKRPLTGAHVARDLLTQRGCRAGERFDRLMQNAHVIGVTDVRFERGRVDANPARLDRAGSNQRSHQLLIEFGHPLLPESVVELDQGRGVGHRIHQREMAEITPRKSLADFPLHLFIAQTPAKLQVHHPKINPYRSARTAHTLIENLLERLEQFGLTEKLIDFLKLLVQFIQRGIDKAVAKTELLSYGCTHSLICTTSGGDDLEENFFSEN